MLTGTSAARDGLSPKSDRLPIVLQESMKAWRANQQQEWFQAGNPEMVSSGRRISGEKPPSRRPQSGLLLADNSALQDQMRTKLSDTDLANLATEGKWLARRRKIYIMFFNEMQWFDPGSPTG